MIFLCSPAGNNCTENIHWQFTHPLLRGACILSTMCGVGVMGKVGGRESMPLGPFSSLPYRTAVSMEKRNPAYLSGCDHA